MGQQGALKLKTLKKAVKANGNHEDMGEGDDQDDERVAEDVKEDEEQDDALMDNEEDGQMDDDSDVDMAEDSMGLGRHQCRQGLSTNYKRQDHKYIEHVGQS